jgi:catechol 2,3-dioxygenase-like lactoylglutathione lyase family enzyme
MKLSCNHITCITKDSRAAKDFYIDKLGLELLDDHGKFFSARAGDVRLSFFESNEMRGDGNMRVVLRTNDLEAVIQELAAKGIEPLEDVVEAPGFFKFITLKDPDDSIIHIGQYLRDPLKGKA